MTGEEVFSPLVTYIVGFLFALVYLGEIPLGSLRSLIGRMILIALFAILLLVVIVFYLIMNPWRNLACQYHPDFSKHVYISSTAVFLLLIRSNACFVNFIFMKIPHG